MRFGFNDCVQLEGGERKERKKETLNSHDTKAKITHRGECGDDDCLSRRLHTSDGWAEIETVWMVSSSGDWNKKPT